MFSLLFLGSAIYYLRQISTWTLPSFRRGIVILKYKEPFPDKISEDVLDQEIICKNIIFKFNTPNTGLFRAYPKIAFFKNRRTSYFPSLLGEIKLNHKGIAQITLRIPLSVTLMSLALFLALITSNPVGVFTINSLLANITEVATVTLLFGIFAFLGFIMEKYDLQDGVIMLRERAKSNSLT